jgi:hypothetical protein
MRNESDLQASSIIKGYLIDASVNLLAHVQVLLIVGYSTLLSIMKVTLPLQGLPQAPT